jgi:Cdc6-like AAA superfamily ATPase
MQHKGFSILDESEPLSISSLFLVLYGLPGVGKTSLSFTMPGKVLHLDPDKGLRRAVQKVRIRRVLRLDYVEPFRRIHRNERH